MYMISSREQAYAALFAKVAGLTSGGSPLFQTATRRLQHFSDVAPENRPALYMEQTGEGAQPQRGLPTLWTLNVTFWIYLSTAEAATGPQLNPLLDAITACFAPTLADGSDGTQTLGGLVTRAWIEGETVIFEGDLGADAIAQVPVKILVS